MRHPQTEVNAKGLMHTTYDPHVFDEVGLRQVEDLIAYCKREKVEAIYASPALRTVETAVAIGDKLGLTPIVLSAFRERSWGEWSGKAWPEIQAQLDPMPLAQRYEFVPPDGESWHQVDDRLRKGLQFLTEQSFGKQAVISHGGTLRALMPIIKDLPKESSFAFDPANASVTTCEYKNGKFTAISENNISHLR